MKPRLVERIGVRRLRTLTQRHLVQLGLLFLSLLQLYPLVQQVAITDTWTTNIVPLSRNSSTTQPVAIFYNLYVASNDSQELQRVRDLVKDQLQWRRSHHFPVFVYSIGSPLSIPDTTLIGNSTKGGEKLTLHALWEYCRAYPESTVVYLHSKGSYHDTMANREIREFLTRGALSDECSNLPSTCNVCSCRFSPVPRPHTPGNMWLAKCDYVQKLVNPLIYQSQLASFPRLQGASKRKGYCFGIGRFSAEDWVYSHPWARPCDVTPTRLLHGVTDRCLPTAT